jgi:hypothetical protein
MAFSESNIHAAPRYQRAIESDQVQFITFRASQHLRGKVWSFIQAHALHVKYQ